MQRGIYQQTGQDFELPVKMQAEAKLVNIKQSKRETLFEATTFSEPELKYKMNDMIRIQLR